LRKSAFVRTGNIREIKKAANKGGLRINTAVCRLTYKVCAKLASFAQISFEAPEKPDVCDTRGSLEACVLPVFGRSIRRQGRRTCLDRCTTSLAIVATVNGIGSTLNASCA
jgi:hypothetical protein